MCIKLLFLVIITTGDIMYNEYSESLVNSLDENMALFKKIFNNDASLIVREFQNRYFPSIHCCIIYMEAMVTARVINDNIIAPIINSDMSGQFDVENLLEELRKKVIAADNVLSETNMTVILDRLIYGDCIFLLDGYNKVLIISSRGWQTRSITEPESARVIRGPREGFTESIMTNISLLRRRIKNPALRTKFRDIGLITHTRICICFIEGLALQEIIDELEKRLAAIEIDGIIDSGYIQEFIRDSPLSPFETVGYSERPDVVAAKLLEGRVAIIADGSPFVLTVPFIIVESVQSNEDYYNHFLISSFTRIIRSTAAVMAVSIPAIYLAIVTFHQEILPTPLLLSISASRQGVPLPTSLSLFMMLLIFDVLREAGTRMPSSIGQAMNIVGTLVLGQAAVEAKLVSAPVIIVTALSGILSLLIPNLFGATTLIKYFLLTTASVLGIYGYIFGIMLIFLHLLSIRSFGIPYFLNMTSLTDYNAQDIWIRVPWWSMKLRPKIIGAKNIRRQSSSKGR